MKRILLSFTLLLLCMTGAWAYDFEVGGIYYNTISGTQNVEVTSGDAEYSGSVVIPESVTNNGTTYSVTSIGDYAFWRCSGLTSVTIPNSVTSIGDYAFSGCRALTSVSIPNSVTEIGSMAFKGSGIATPLYNDHVFAYMPVAYKGEYSIPDGITHIAGGAFYECNGLASVSIPNSVTSIGDKAFFYCLDLTSVTIAKSVTSIGEQAFEYCRRLTSVTIPESVTSIGGYAFSGCRALTSVSLPNSVTEIGNGAFNGIGMESPLYNDHVFAYMPVAYKGEYSIQDGITHIAGGAFYGCNGLSSVSIPNSVTEIGSMAFKGSGIATPLYNDHVFAYMPVNHKGEYSIPDGVKYMAGGAFYDCLDLTSVTIPESVDSIGSYAFYGCRNLRNVFVLAKVPPTVSSHFISELAKIQFVAVPCDCKDKYQETGVWKTYEIKEVNLAGNNMLSVKSSDMNMGYVHILSPVSCDKNEAVIEAVPNWGYHFVQWNDGNTDNPRSVTVTENVTFTAEFDKGTAVDTQMEETVTVTAGNRKITVYGADGEIVTVYNMQGVCIYSAAGNEPLEIQVPSSGIYLVKTGTETVKVAVR